MDVRHPLYEALNTLPDTPVGQTSRLNSSQPGGTNALDYPFVQTLMLNLKKCALVYLFCCLNIY